MATTLVAPIALQQSNQDFYVGRGFLHTIQAAVNAAYKTGLPALVIIPQGYGGADPIASVTGGTDYIYIVDQREGNPFIYQWNGSFYDGPFFDIDGTKLNRDTAINLNGHTLNLGGGTTNIANLTAPLIEADEANFVACNVDNSPVRTFENSPDPGGWMIYPPEGIAVSTGEEWDNSIDPATLATWPPSGIPVSTGTNWGISINPTTLATTAQLSGFLPLTGGTVTGNLAVETTNPVSVSISSPEPYLIMKAVNAPVNQKAHVIGADPNSGQLWFSFGTDDFTASLPWMIASRSGIQPTELEIKPPVQISNGALNVPQGEVLARGYQTLVQYAGPSSAIGVMSNSPYLRLYNLGPDWTQASFKISADSDGSIHFLSGDTLDNYPLQWLYFLRSGITPTLAAFQCSLSVVGDLNVSGAKNFRITHPADSKKTLTHSVLEGPECALFYRGEAQTKDGKATINLPDYFESLVTPENRSVLLTPLFESADEEIGWLAASHVKAGKFSVRSALPSQRFYWEVKAVRGDIPPLEVIGKAQPQAKAPQMSTAKPKSKR